ncbi:MAG: hypothetical protein R6X17_15730, partial [Candidatus Competibacteraceae bacterium]
GVAGDVADQEIELGHDDPESSGVSAHDPALPYLPKNERLGCQATQPFQGQTNFDDWTTS